MRLSRDYTALFLRPGHGCLYRLSCTRFPLLLGWSLAVSVCP
jgi:hypothetical protein